MDLMSPATAGRNTIMKHLSRFNRSQALLVISTYPDPKIGIQGMDAVAWHSHKTLHSLATKSKKIVIFGQKTVNSPDIYLDSPHILVTRTWNKGQPFSLLNTLSQILKFTHAQTVLFQFEFNIFGGVLPVLLIPLIVFILRLAGKNVIFEMHQVVTDIKQLQTHLNLKNPLFQNFFNLGLRFFYFSIGLLANHIVILEEELKHRLSRFVPAKKINFIPISVIKQKKISKIAARKHLGYNQKDFIVMSFGFINWYKGSDWIVKAFSFIYQKNIKLILAGGESATLKTKKYYQSYYSRLQAQVQANPHVSLTGFVPDDQIRLYFSAADLIVLPYRVFMSSSGPLSLAFSFTKPLLFSAPLVQNYLNSPDIQLALSHSSLKASDLGFPLNSRYFPRHLTRARTNLKKLTRFSSLMAESRSQANVSQKYRDLINSGRINYAPDQIFASAPC